MAKQQNQFLKVGTLVISLFVLGACSSTSEMEEESSSTEAAASTNTGSSSGAGNNNQLTQEQIRAQNALRQKRVDRMNLRVYKSAGVSIDGNLVPVRSFGENGNSPLNSSLVPSTGIIEDNNGGNGWDREVAPLITVNDPTPFHLQAISYEVSSS